MAVALVTGCPPPGARYQKDFSRLQHWLICDECVAGEREAARRLGARAVGKLDSALVGPSEGRKDLIRAKLSDSFRFAQSPGGDSNAYINPRLANYIATYQKRAAIALGDIGNDAARDALDRAISEAAFRGYRADVIDVIERVRARLSSPPFRGTISPAVVSFGGVVTVVSPPGRHFSPQDHAAISDAAFPPDQIPFTRLGDTLRFVAVGEPGSHAVVVTDPQANGGSTVGWVTIGSLLDVTDRAALGCSTAELACAVANAQRPMPALPGHQAMFLTLSRLPPRPDTVDFLKFEPPVNLPVTAVLDWHGAANLDLAWRTCSPFGPVANGTVASFARAESTSVVVPARDCWILQVSMGQGEAGPVFARLRMRSP